MHLHTKEQAVKQMNNWGLLRRPFIFIINYLQDASYVEEISSVDPTELLYNLNGFTNQSTSDKSNENSCLNNKKEHIHWQSFPESFDIYRHSFNIVQRNIFAGNSFLTNLTCRTPIETNLTLQDIYFRSKAIYKLWLKDSFTVFSPEIFVRIHQGKISSYPMKGTIDASIPDAFRLLMDDPKEAAEHATIVDLIRNDLSMVANQVSVSRYRYIDTLQTNQGAILQTSSEIQGVLPEDYQEHVGETIFKLLPAGSITGAPKKKTMQIIQEAEIYDRGFYTGIMGYFDGENLDSAVMIRFVEQEGEKMYFKSGGGITCQSDVESEYNEMKQKYMCPFIETIRIEDGKIYNLDYHTERFNRTRAAFWKDSTPLDLQEFISPQSLQGIHKCRIVYGREIEEITYAPYQMREVSSLRLVVADTIDYTYKSTNREELNILYAQRETADDVLIVRNGYLTDTSIANVALYDGKMWYTPSHPLLRGTKRAELLDRQLIVEKDIPQRHLGEYSKVMLFNAMIDWGRIVLPIDDKHFIL